MPKHIESGSPAETNEALPEQTIEKRQQEEVTQKNESLHDPKKVAAEMERDIAIEKKNLEAGYGKEQKSGNKQLQENVGSMNKGLDSDIEWVKKQFPDAWKKAQDKNKPLWEKIKDKFK